MDAGFVMVPLNADFVVAPPVWLHAAAHKEDMQPGKSVVNSLYGRLEQLAADRQLALVLELRAVREHSTPVLSVLPFSGAVKMRHSSNGSSQD